MRHAVDDAVRGAAYDAVGVAVNSAVDDAVWRPVYDTAGGGGVAVYDAVYVAVRDAVGVELKEVE